MSISLNKISILLIISLIVGQLLKFPVTLLRGPALLDITIIFLSLLGIYKFYLKKQSYGNLPLYFYLFVIFILVCIISLLLNPLSLSLNQILISSLYITRLSIFAIFFYFVFKKILVFNAPEIFIYSGVILSILGILQFIFIPDLGFLETFGWDPHYLRAVSTFLDPNFLGGFLILSLLNIYLFDFKKQKVKITLFSLVYVCLALTFSRSSYLFFLISSLSLGFLLKSGRILKFSILLTLVLFVIFYIYQINITIPRNINRGDSAQNRLDTWAQGFRLFLKHPIFGVGFNTYKFALEKYKFANVAQINSRGSASNDASLLFVLSTTGIIGFMVFLSFITSILYFSMKNKETNLGSLVFSGVLGLLVNSFFINSIFYPSILIWLILYLGSLKSSNSSQ